MPAVAATLRAPDLAENNPDHARDRYERLRDFVNKQGNRRVTFVELTEKGDKLSRELVPLIGEFMTTTANALTDEEKRQFIDLLVKFRTNAEASYLD